MSDKLRTRVFDSLNDAMENGYDVSTWTAQDIAIDLVCFDAELEDETAESLVPHAQAWLNER